MTPLPLVPNVVRVAVSLQVGQNKTAGCRFYWKYGNQSQPTNADMTAFAQAVIANWITALIPMMPGTNALNSVLCQDLASNTGAQAEIAGFTAGTRTGNALPQDCATLINFDIARRYRGGKPRIYLPCGTDTDQADERTWSQTFRDEMNAAWTTFKTLMNGESQIPWPVVDHCNVGYYSGVEPPTTLPSGRVKQANKKLTTPYVDLITGHQVAAVFGSQRRRLAT